MKAISLKPGTTAVFLAEVPEPEIKNQEEIKMQVWQVGICGTDREQAEGGRSDAPAGKSELIIGHEMFGQVVAVGSEVKTVRVGDYGLFTVRRGCGKCIACNNNRSDLCFTGDYTERGIKGADGFQAAFVVDKEQYFVKVPEELKDIGVLTEPMSVAAKAIHEALKIQQARLEGLGITDNWLQGKKVLVAGIGAIGLLAAFALRLRGAEVYGMDIVDETSLRPQILQAIGGKYIHGNKVKPAALDDELGQVDLVFEATGVAELQFQLIDALGINGLYVATGIPSGTRPLTIEGADLMRQLVLKNQIVLGSVNAGMEHFDFAVADLKACKERWPETIQQLITERFPISAFKEALHHHNTEEIKVVVDWI